MSTKNNNPYEQHIFGTLERAILAEDVIFTKIKNVEGKFYVKVMTPTVDTTTVTLRSVKGITAKNYLPLIIPAYLLYSFMKPTIETVTFTQGTGTSAKQVKKILYTLKQTTFTIPKGTKFLVEILGGDVEADMFHIVGLELDENSLLDTEEVTTNDTTKRKS
jgi:hypothetical protein